MAEKIKMTFLGTGSAIPTARRNHSAILLQYKAENILVDCGEGTQRQFRKAKLNPCKISKILISHWHGDHTLGLPGLLQTLVLNGYNEKLEIYGPKGTKQKMKEVIDVFMKWYFHTGKKFDIDVHEVSEGIFFDNEEFFIESSSVDHEVPAVAYAFIIKEKNRLDRKKLVKLKIPNSPLMAELSKGKTVEIDGKKIDGKKLIYKEPFRKITFIMDTRKCDNLIKIAEGSDVLVCESSFSENEKEIAEEYAHLTSVDAATIAKKAKVKSLFLVHLSQRYDAVPKMILEEAKKVFKSVAVAEDFDKLEL